jgi:hypothetical protein
MLVVINPFITSATGPRKALDGSLQVNGLPDRRDSRFKGVCGRESTGSTHSHRQAIHTHTVTIHTLRTCTPYSSIQWKDIAEAKPGSQKLSRTSIRLL